MNERWQSTPQGRALVTGGRAVHRPALLRAPRFALELALGEVAAVVLASQRVVPKRALDAGFEFAHPTLDEALAATLEGRQKGTSHHITRLMVLANIATLLDVSPRELADWFWPRTSMLTTGSSSRMFWEWAPSPPVIS